MQNELEIKWQKFSNVCRRALVGKRAFDISEFYQASDDLGIDIELAYELWLEFFKIKEQNANKK